MKANIVTAGKTYDLSQRFYFEAAHTLRREIEAESSRRIHGHTYEAEVTVRGQPDPTTGMVIDLALLREHIRAVRNLLDHQFLDDVEGLGPPTLENLCAFILERLGHEVKGLAVVSVWRQASGDRCTVAVVPGWGAHPEKP